MWPVLVGKEEAGATVAEGSTEPMLQGHGVVFMRKSLSALFLHHKDM